MKKIYFDKLNSWKNAILIVPAVILLLISGLSFFTDQFDGFSKAASGIANLLMVIFFGKMFFFKNYVSWNNLGFNIKFKKVFGENFSFNKIEYYNFECGILNIKKTNGKEYQFNLNDFIESDQKKLLRILEDNTVGNIG